MKKIWRKTFATLLALSTLFATTACTDLDDQALDDEKVDTAKTQLYVQNYNGGFGDKWLDAVIKRFEADYANQSFEEGKTGVQVKKQNNKSGNVTLKQTLENSTNDVFFVELAATQDLINSNLLYDMTDLVTTPLTEFGETESIVDKLNPASKAFFSKGGKYYGLPHYEGYDGLTYNVDLWNSEFLWLAENENNGNNGFVRSLTEPRGKGPDGKTGTENGVDYTLDDGLPATYEEFFKLCTRLKQKGISPIGWTGKYMNYVNGLVAAIEANHDGAAVVTSEYFYDGGNVEIVESVNSDGSLNTSTIQLTAENGYYQYQTEGKYYALSFLEKIIDNGWYSSESFSNVQGHLQAQSAFLDTGFEPKAEKIAMHMDGNWWVMEARAAFDEMTATFGDRASAENRNIAWMPFPKATKKEVGEGNTLVDKLWSACYINKRVGAKADLAELFVRYCHTDKSLQEFTSVTNTAKSFKYDLTSEQYNQLTPFGKSLWNTRQKATIAYSYSDHPLYVNDSGTFFFGDQYVTKTSSGTHNLVATAMKDKGVSALDYFMGLRENKSATVWSNNYSTYFGL